MLAEIKGHTISQVVLRVRGVRPNYDGGRLCPNPEIVLVGYTPRGDYVRLDTYHPADEGNFGSRQSYKRLFNLYRDLCEVFDS
jgi:hypothetical protein